jgi:branched-chain amino acid transport system substrate-binding protein
LLGRPVEFVRCDDRADAALVPANCRRLMDQDGGDLVGGGYGTNTLLPAMPVMMKRRLFFVGLMGFGVVKEML